MIPVVLDVDGTLVDSVYQHTVAWHRAFQENGVEVCAAAAHSRIGMGGDQLVPSLAGEEIEARCGEAIRARHDELYAAGIEAIRPLPGARELLEALAAEDRPVVLSSSAKGEEIERYVDLLGAGDLVVGWTTSDDVAQTKPRPDLVRAALRMLRRETAVMVGDSPWDVRAALAANIPTIGVDTGGFGRDALIRAGARVVVSALGDVGAHLCCGDRRGAPAAPRSI